MLLLMSLICNGRGALQNTNAAENDDDFYITTGHLRLTRT